MRIRRHGKLSGEKFRQFAMLAWRRLTSPWGALLNLGCVAKLERADLIAVTRGRGSSEIVEVDEQVGITAFVLERAAACGSASVQLKSNAARWRHRITRPMRHDRVGPPECPRGPRLQLGRPGPCIARPGGREHAGSAAVRAATRGCPLQPVCLGHRRRRHCRVLEASADRRARHAGRSFPVGGGATRGVGRRALDEPSLGCWWDRKLARPVHPPPTTPITGRGLWISIPAGSTRHRPAAGNT